MIKKFFVTVLLIAATACSLLQPPAPSPNNQPNHPTTTTNTNPAPLPSKSQEPISKDSPFGVHEVRFGDSKEIEYIKDLRADAARLAPMGSLIWDAIEKERGKYDWAVSDKVIGIGYGTEIKLLATVLPANRLDTPGIEPGKGGYKLPRSIEWYLEFLKKAAERYDGDGVDDAPGSPKIDVIQIGNEIDSKHFWNDTPENYALLLKKSYQAIKEVAPNIKVAIAGEAIPSTFSSFYKPVLEELIRIKDGSGDQYFDIFDFHWSGQFTGENDYATLNLPGGKYEMRNFISTVKNELGKINYKNISFYITEMSDYSDTPSEYAKHTETYHASAVMKRYAYALASGVNKIYWAQIIEQHNFGGQSNGYFDNVALVNNPQNSDGLSHKKLAYYTYKKMVEVLEGSDWNNVQTVQEKDGIYIYKFTKNGKSIWVGWNDNSASKTVEINTGNVKQVKITEAVPRYETGKDVVDYNKAFNVETKPAQGDKTTITLKDKPVFVEEQ